MHLFSKTLRRVGQPRAAGRTPRRFLIESLETRDLMAALPLNVVNSTTINGQGDLAYKDDQVWVAVYAQVEETGAFYYFDDHGIPAAAAGLSKVPAFQLSDMHAVMGKEHFYVINMPDKMPNSQFGPKGARMYFGFGGMDAAPDLPINSGDVEPMSPDNSYFDYIEFTINGKSGSGSALNNLNIDTTSVDQFGAPIHVQVDSSELSGGSKTIGIDATRASVISQYMAFTSHPNDHYRTAVWPVDGANGPYRIQNPSDVLLAPEIENTALQVQTFLSQALSNSATTAYVWDTKAFPSTASPGNPFTVQVNNEKMSVIGVGQGPGGSIKWTVTRGVDGTTAATHVVSAQVLPAGPAITATQTTITMANVTGYPDPNTTPFFVQIGSESMKVTGAYPLNQDHTTTWTVQRARFDSTATTHDNGDNVYWNSMRDNRFASMFNPMVDQLFTKYLKVDASSPKLYIKSNEDQQTYVGQVVHEDEVAGTGPYVLRFHVEGNPTSTPAYDVYYPFFEENRYFWGGYIPSLAVASAPEDELVDVAGISPSTMVFGCSGVFGDSGQRSGLSAEQQSVLGDLENQIVAALNRGVALVDNQTADSWNDTDKYYGGPTHTSSGEIWNRYAQFLHQTSVSYDGLNYGFAYDDNNQQASDIGISALSSITSVTATLGAWDTGSSQLDLSGLPNFVGSYLKTGRRTSAPQSSAAPESDVVDAPPTPTPVVAQAVDAALLSALHGNDFEAPVLDDSADAQDDELNESTTEISAQILLSEVA